MISTTRSLALPFIALFASLGALAPACSSDPDDEENGNTGGSNAGGAGGESGSGGEQPGDPCQKEVDLSRYDFDLQLSPSSQPPGGLAPSEVPQFVVIGWDDNGFREPFVWATDFLADRDLKNTFYFTTTYISDGATSGSPVGLRNAWTSARETGHEIGNHTQYHLNGTPFSFDEWTQEISVATEWLITAPEAEEDPGIGLPPGELYGFRSPFLNYNDELYNVLKTQGIWYDCSIEEGFQLDQDASNMFWPYTLDSGSPGHDYLEALGVPERDFDLNAHPGMIELPAYALVLPPDEVAEEYEFEEGLIERTHAVYPPVEGSSDRITGLDYNLWADAKMTAAEFLAVLKYNLDQRLAGNRAPLLFGAHTDFYRENWPSTEVGFEERRQAIEDFIDYANSLPDVRVTTAKELVDFIREPRPLSCSD